MAMDESTVLVCLFHDADEARAAVEELREAGVEETEMTWVGGDESVGTGTHDAPRTLARLGVPERDLAHMSEGLEDGGSVISVRAAGEMVGVVERIFAEHRAGKIDEVVESGKTVEEGLVKDRDGKIAEVGMTGEREPTY